MALPSKKVAIKAEDYCFRYSLNSRLLISAARYSISLLFVLSFGVIFLTGCAGTSPQHNVGTDGVEKKSTSVLPWQSGGLKIGYIRSDVINRDYPEYRDADNELQFQNRKWLQEAKKLEQQIRKREREQEELSLIFSEERRIEIQAEITSKRKELQKFQNDTWYSDNSSYIKRRREVMEPIDARVNDAIWKVAEERDLDMVFDTIAGNVVYVKPALDITEDVLEELKR